MVDGRIKTTLFLGLMSGLLLGIGQLMGGKTGLTIMLAVAILFNLVSYFYSHKIVLFIYKARKADAAEFQHLHTLVSGVARDAGIPKPEIYIIPTKNPNAFATGPTQKKAVVAFTEGILDLLNREELKGVIAHEIAHIKNRDMLITTIAATLATVISYIAAMARWTAIFSSDRDGNNMFEFLIIGILSPLIALILQLAISRSREYMADATGAKIIKNSNGLASALEKLHQSNKSNPMNMGSETTSSLFIVNPFKGNFITSLFSTHPPAEERIKRLKEMRV